MALIPCLTIVHAGATQECLVPLCGFNPNRKRFPNCTLKLEQVTCKKCLAKVASIRAKARAKAKLNEVLGNG